MFRRLLLVASLVFSFALLTVNAQDDVTVVVSDDPDLGQFLTDAEGITLYLFTQDDPTSGSSVCNDQCAENWPPFMADDPLTLPNDVPGELTQITRDDGSMQVAYNGWPLYYWANDAAPGDTTGQGVGDVWYVVMPVDPDSGATPMASPMASPIASPAGTPDD